MALSDWLAGNGKFKKDAAKKPTVASVANGLLHLEQEPPQQTSAFAPTVAEIASVAEDSSNNIYILNQRIIILVILLHLLHLLQDQINTGLEL